uniref:SWIM-type domain-containing protein n=1 Tax=Ananas comosus var. bracteatus TaxID=296719 RepID=A0A6V7PZU0_ANACO|nr:unnamed protein product [Ananas comosus var. bracteatus]
MLKCHDEFGVILLYVVFPEMVDAEALNELTEDDGQGKQVKQNANVVGDSEKGINEPHDGNVSEGVEENKAHAEEDVEDGSESDSSFHEWSNFGDSDEDSINNSDFYINTCNVEEEDGTHGTDNDQSSEYQPSEDLDSMSSLDEDGPSWPNKVEGNKRKARHCEPLWAGETIFEVHCNGKQYTVNLTAASCECRQWDVTGVLCKHVVSAIFKQKLDHKEFVHKYFLNEIYIRTYSQMIMPLNDSSMWPIVGIEPIMPSPYRRQPGRLKSEEEGG